MRWPALAAILCSLALPAQAQLRLASAAKAEPAAAEPAYVDRVIEGITPQDADEADAKPYDRDGWPRFLRIETRLGTAPFGEERRHAGVVASAAIDTPNHGVVSFDATTAPSEGRSAITLRQRGLPVEGGWFVNNEVGVLTPQAPAVMRAPTRVFIPSVYTRGASTEWLGPNGLQWMASSGEPGVLQGYPVPGFRALGGTLTLAGAQAAAQGWIVGARHAYADNIDPTNGGGSARVIANSAHVAARRESADDSLQAQAVAARSSADGKSRYGAWIDGEHKDGRALYGWGVYRLDPNLTWAGQSMASDIEGAYARGSWHTRQWSASSSVDVLRSLSGDEDTGVLVTASGQWRYSRTLTFGGGTTVRRYNGNGLTAFGDLRWLHDYGRTGLRAEATRYTDQERSTRLVLDHEWPLSQGFTLGTSLWGGRESGVDRSGTLWGAAASLAAPLGSNAMLLANGTAERRGNGDRYASANVSLTWQLTRAWAVEGNVLYSRGEVRQVLPLDPLGPLDRVATTQDNRAVYLMVRYEDRAGTRVAPLGGPTQGGGGRIAGRVFLDANRNGTLEANEQGAANVTVYLDGRYAARTDAQGRFEFPFVAPGARVLTVVNETLPLPWEVGERSQNRVEVNVRETTDVLIPVIRRE